MLGTLRAIEGIRFAAEAEAPPDDRCGAEQPVGRPDDPSQQRQGVAAAVASAWRAALVPRAALPTPSSFALHHGRCG